MSTNPNRITKKQLRIILDISPTALQKMLNWMYIEQLEAAGYKRSQKFLLKHQLDIIFPNGLDFEKLQ